MTLRLLLPAVASVVLIAFGQVAFGQPKAVGASKMDAKVKLPARLMTGVEVLREIHAQTGLQYAYPTGAIVAQIDATRFKGEATVKAVVENSRRRSNSAATCWSWRRT